MRLIVSFIFLLLCGLCGCSYRLGTLDRSLPGGYNLVSVPVFSNKSTETAFETYFTNAIIQQFERAKVARVVDSSEAQITLIGTIDSVSLSAASEMTSKDRSGVLPRDAILTTTYRMVVGVTIELQRNSDRKTLWSGKFSNETSYNAAQVTISGLNSVNPLYNQSAKEQNIDRLAKDMMIEAHDRMTENF